jgi:protein-tyrosine phosphatase
MPTPAPMSHTKPIGRIDVHSHLLPGIDDGCPTLDESLQCAAVLVENGYTHSFVTPHVWPSYPHITTESVPQLAANLQTELDSHGIPLRLLPGGEMNLRPGFIGCPDKFLPSYAMAGKYALIDLWADELPVYFEPAMRWMQSRGLKVVLAHPERMRAVQDSPELADYFDNLGLLLQGNLACLNDPRSADNRRVAERYLGDGRYFMLGSDLHRRDTLDTRMAGLRNAIRLVGEAAVHTLTHVNPGKLLPE